MKMANRKAQAKEEEKWVQFGVKLIMNTITHPIEYAKVLMQIGHEPIQPKATTTLFGKPALALPNMFQYIGYIKSVDGTSGLFRGLSAKLCSNIVSSASFQKVKENFQPFDERVEEFDDDGDEIVERKQAFAREFVTDLVGHTVAVITSHPFQVIAVRMMSEFVGGENKYCSILGSIKEIYNQNGVIGFFSGLVPRLIGDLLTVCVTTSCTFLIHVYLTDDEEIRNYSNAVVGFIATAFTYPFHVVSNCMIVSSSGLKAGSPPYMPEYSTWIECWHHLKRTNQIKRGSSLLWRYYTGPFVIINDKPVIVNKDDFVPTTKLRQ